MKVTVSWWAWVAVLLSVLVLTVALVLVAFSLIDANRHQDDSILLIARHVARLERGR